MTTSRSDPGDDGCQATRYTACGLERRRTDARSLEIISPAGFERFFVEVAQLFSDPVTADADELERPAMRFELTFDFEKVNFHRKT